MSTFGGLKVSTTPVNYSVSGTFGGSTTLYTASAASFGIVNLSVRNASGSNWTGLITAGNCQIQEVTGATLPTANTLSIRNIVVGPGHAIQISNTSGNTVTIALNGIELQN